MDKGAEKKRESQPSPTGAVAHCSKAAGRHRDASRHRRHAETTATLTPRIDSTPSNLLAQTASGRRCAENAPKQSWRLDSIRPLLNRSVRLLAIDYISWRNELKNNYKIGKRLISRRGFVAYSSAFPYSIWIRGLITWLYDWARFLHTRCLAAGPPAVHCRVLHCLY